MTDREKVIKGLESLHKRLLDAAAQDRIAMLDANMVSDALAMLKAQEPRVLTLEEALSSDECWIEGRNGACGYGDALLTDDAERVEFFRPHTISTLEFYAYGKDWRCWSAKPTAEQREAAKWDE